MQTIVVSGASRGIGFQICLKAAAEGNKVIALSRNIESLSNIENIHPFAVDLLNHKEIVGFFEVVKSEFGSIDILSNNAATKTNNLKKFLFFNSEIALFNNCDVSLY